MIFLTSHIKFEDLQRSPKKLHIFDVVLHKIFRRLDNATSEYFLPLVMENLVKYEQNRK